MKDSCILSYGPLLIIVKSMLPMCRFWLIKSAPHRHSRVYLPTNRREAQKRAHRFLKPVHVFRKWLYPTTHNFPDADFIGQFTFLKDLKPEIIGNDQVFECLAIAGKLF